MALSDELQKALDAYKATNGANGMSTELYRYAQDHPEALIDRSGNNLAPTDSMFNFYNPLPGQTPGVDWFPTDDRNNDRSNTSLTAALSQTAPKGYAPQADPTAMPGTGFAPTAGSKPVITDTGKAAITGDMTASTKVPSAVAGTASSSAPTGTTGGLAGNLAGDNIAINTGGPTGNQTNDLIGQLLAQVMKIGTGEVQGLSPEARAALLTQALETVPGQFDAQQRQLATSLLRRGGGLPEGGDFLRAYGPMVAAREAAKSQGVRDVILKDEELKQQNRQLNSQERIAGLQTAAQLTGQLMQMDISKLDAATREKLAQMGIDSNEKLANLDAQIRLQLGQLSSQTQLDLGKLDADTRLKLADMGITSNYQLAQMDADLKRELTKMGIDSNEFLGKLDSQTRIDIAQIQAKAGSSTAAILASLGSSALSNPTLMKSAIDGLKSVLGIGGAAAGTAAAGAGAGAGAGGAAAGGGFLSGFGGTMGAFFTNPFTIGIGAALVVGTAILKSQAHWEANDMVKQFENPYAQSFITPIHDQFFSAASQGQLSKEQAQAARAEVAKSWEEYKAKIHDWGKSGDKKTVADQSEKNLAPWISQILRDMDAVIAQGGYDRNLGKAA